jgi:protein gp37
MRLPRRRALASQCRVSVSVNARFAGGTAINWGPGAPRRRTSPANWRKPLQWNAHHEAFFAEQGRRQRVFCASLADVFDNAVDPAWRADLFDLIEKTQNLDWLLLTKRIGNVMPMISETAQRRFDLECIEAPRLPDNVWIGATVVNQAEADRDIPKLLSVPARVRFLSMEPLLGPVALTRLAHGDESDLDALRGQVVYTSQHFAVPPEVLGKAISWVIVGGESGHGARPMQSAWAQSLRDQCEAARVPFLFKQWGELLPGETDGESYAVALDGSDREFNGTVRLTEQGGQQFFRIGKKIAGRQLDGRTHDDFPRGA